MVNLGLIKLFLFHGVAVDVSEDVITMQIQHSLQSIGLVRLKLYLHNSLTFSA